MPDTPITASMPSVGEYLYNQQLRYARDRQNGQRSLSDWDDVDGYSQSFQLVANPDSASPKIEPSGSGHINIVEDFKWTYSKFRGEVPRILLIERQIQKNQQLGQYKRAFGVLNPQNADEAKSDPYAGLYADAVPTGFTYTLPYYSSNTVNITQSWNASINSSSNIYGGLAEKALNTKIFGETTVGQIGGAARDLVAMSKNSPMFGYEQPMYYSGPSTNTYNIKFPLFNTDTVGDIRRNLDFIKIFTFQNLFERRTFATSLPPVIYECEFAQGYIATMAHKPALYVSRFEAKNIGAIRAIYLGGQESNVLVPEAYMIDIQLSELVATSRNIFASFLTGTAAVNVYGG